MDPKIMKIETEIREYNDEYGVTIIKQMVPWRQKEEDRTERFVVHATNEGGYNSTEVDLLDVIDWVKKNMPELLHS